MNSIDRAKQAHTTFRVLCGILSEYSTHTLLEIPGVYEIMLTYFADEIMDTIEEMAAEDEKS